MTSLIRKTMERILVNEITDHMTRNNLISKRQRGSLKGKSTTCNLIEYTDTIANALEEGNAMYVLYTDFSKFFDRIKHKFLLNALENRYGIKGNLLIWIRNWLHGRKQRVVLRNVKTEWKEVKSSVVQGSVLGVLSAILYADSIDGVVGDCHIFKYVDDNKIVKFIKTAEDEGRFQETINDVSRWVEEQNLELNVSKCAVLRFAKRSATKNLHDGQSTSCKPLQKGSGLIC